MVSLVGVTGVASPHPTSVPALGGLRREGPLAVRHQLMASVSGSWLFLWRAGPGVRRKRGLDLHFTGGSKQHEAHLGVEKGGQNSGV